MPQNSHKGAGYKRLAPFVFASPWSLLEKKAEISFLVLVISNPNSVDTFCHFHWMVDLSPVLPDLE